MQPEMQSVSALGHVRLDQTDASDDTMQFITFTLGEDEYGIDIMVVREIKGWTDTTTIPNAPAHVRGVINLRGVIVPIFDLRTKFGWGRTVPTNTHVVIIVAAGSRTIGLLVDTVSDIIAVDSKAIRAVPDLGLPAQEQYLEGLVTIENRMVTLVSLARLFGKSAETAERPAASEPSTIKAA